MKSLRLLSEKSSPSTNSFRAWSDEKNRQVCLMKCKGEVK